MLKGTLIFQNKNDYSQGGTWINTLADIDETLWWSSETDRESSKNEQ